MGKLLIECMVKHKLDAFSEVPDLTHGPTVEIFRRWDQKQAAFTELLRFIRISSSLPLKIVVSKPGKHLSITGSTTSIPADTDEAMCVDQHSCQ
jgi:translation machinery-associated protein 16